MGSDYHGLFHKYKVHKKINLSDIFDTLPVKPFIQFGNMGTQSMRQYLWILFLIRKMLQVIMLDLWGHIWG
jgi:hypothetical protein